MIFIYFKKKIRSPFSRDDVFISLLLISNGEFCYILVEAVNWCFPYYNRLMNSTLGCLEELHACPPHILLHWLPNAYQSHPLFYYILMVIHVEEHQITSFYR